MNNAAEAKRGVSIYGKVGRAAGSTIEQTRGVTHQNLPIHSIKRTFVNNSGGGALEVRDTVAGRGRRRCEQALVLSFDGDC